MPNANPMALTSPCGACPFRLDGELVHTLPKERKQEIADSIRREEVFTCHKTIKREYDDEGELIDSSVLKAQELVCAGATLVTMSEGLRTRPLALGEHLGLWTPEQMTSPYPMPKTFQEWIDA